MEQKDYRHLVRIADTDLDGSKPLYKALTKIKGVGFMFSNMICNLVGIDKFKQTGSLSEAETKKIEDAVKNPEKFSVPSWLLNRRKDYETGEDKHLLGADMRFTQDNDVKILKKIKSYRGMRHAWGLPVRGQRTKSNFRKNKGKVQGVKRKKGKSGKV